MRLPRPYIPWSTRRVVIERQLRAAGIEPTSAEKYTGSDERATRWMIERLFPGEKVELHHRPALSNRKKVIDWIAGLDLDKSDLPKSYKPDANDPDFLVYLPIDDHDVETRVRGQHGQYSDLALARKRKRKERKLKLVKLRIRVKRPKRPWPSRPLRSRNDLRRER